MLFIKTLCQCKWTSGYSKTNKFSPLSNTVCQNRPQKAKSLYQWAWSVNETSKNRQRNPKDASPGASAPTVCGGGGLQLLKQDGRRSGPVGQTIIVSGGLIIDINGEIPRGAALDQRCLSTDGRSELAEDNYRINLCHLGLYRQCEHAGSGIGEDLCNGVRAPRGIIQHVTQRQHMQVVKPGFYHQATHRIAGIPSYIGPGAGELVGGIHCQGAGVNGIAQLGRQIFENDGRIETAVIYGRHCIHPVNTGHCAGYIGRCIGAFYRRQTHVDRRPDHQTQLAGVYIGESIHIGRGPYKPLVESDDSGIVLLAVKITGGAEVQLCREQLQVAFYYLH